MAWTEESLRRLGLDYLDLHLIHWPNPSVGRYVEAWRALVDLRERGLVRTIGVSNFTGEHLARIIDETGVTPAVNQLELHPAFNQHAMRQVAAGSASGPRRGAPWAGAGRSTSAPAGTPPRQHGVTPGQVIVRWHVQLGSLAIPKSATPERQRQNLDVFVRAHRRRDGRDRLTRPPRRPAVRRDPNTHEEM